MIVCGLDLETNGLDVENGKILEIGLVNWDTDKRKPLRIVNLLISDHADDVPPEITALTGLEGEELRGYGTTIHVVAQRLAHMIPPGMPIVAHNGNLFDRPFLLNSLKRQGFDELHAQLALNPWVDTSCDIEYPERWRGRNLTYLAAEHGFLNPFPHRAVSDVLTMLKVLGHYDFDKVLATSKEPNVIVQALCLPPWEDNGKSTDEAKLNGFRWEGSKKRWVKSIKPSQLEKENAKAKQYTLAEVKQ